MNNDGSLVNKPEPEEFWSSAFQINGSITLKILPNVLAVVAYSMIIEIFHHYFPWIAFEVTPFEYSGVMLGLVLVFRVNEGYDRWWEARKVWGSIVNQSRNLAIVLTHYHTENRIVDTAWIDKAVNMVASLPFLMKNHLRGHRDLSQVPDLLDKETLEIVDKATHRPNILAGEIAKTIQQARNEKQMDSFSFLKAEEQRSILIDCLGACERILKTPMPYVMSIKARRFILLFLLILPLALVKLTVYINLPVTALVAYALFSLDQIGIELQSPFDRERYSHLPLNEICTGIKNAVLEIGKQK